MCELKHSEKAKLPSKFGDFTIQAFSDGKKEHLAIFTEPLKEIPLFRIHSECLTGDALGSLKCDCRGELEIALRRIAKEGGMVLYLRQEGRGIGLLNKVNAYALQDQGYDTVEANIALGFRDDERDYSVAGEILKYYGITSVRLLTNNPKKVDSLSKYVQIFSREEILADKTCYNENYLKTKRDKLGHLL
ncbi:MAG: GTP cyclohydrolase II [Wolinella sp.]